jgi:sugar phosphate isomerase/epimerase
VNIAVDGEHSPYAVERDEREKAIQFSKQWVDVAAAIGARSIRTNIPAAADSKPDLERTAESLRRVAEYGAAKNVVINLENDNPASEDPFFLVQVLDKVNSPWLHALPDFANSLTAFDAEHAYTGINAMFGHAYGICHVKAKEENSAGQEVQVDLAKTFGMLKSNRYLGYCSMEFDSPGDPYRGTAELIEMTVRYLS